MQKETLWKDLGTNFVLRHDSHYISYNPNTHIGNPFKAFDGVFINSSTEETALVANGQCLILNGDFREEYESVHEDLEKCMEVYNKHKDKHRSGWSEDLDIKDALDI